MATTRTRHPLDTAHTVQSPDAPTGDHAALQLNIDAILSHADAKQPGVPGAVLREDARPNTDALLTNILARPTLDVAPSTELHQPDTEAYWQALLQGFTKASLGELIPHPVASASCRADTMVHITSGIGEPQVEHLRVRIAVLSAWAAVLSAHTGSDDIVVAEVLTKSEKDASGYFLVPRRIQFTSANTAHQQLSIQIAQDAIHASRAWEAAKMRPEGVYSLVEILSESEIMENSRSLVRAFEIPLQLSATYTASGAVVFSLNFDPGAFAKGDVEYMLNHLVLAFQQLLADPTTPHHQVHLMSAEERSFTLNVPTIDIEAEKLGLEAAENPMQYHYAHELLLRQVSARPDAVAVEWESEPLYTYAELDAASNKLARYLMSELGVRLGGLVMLFSHHSPHIIVMLYALLKIGAPYLPVDIDSPPELFRRSIEGCSSDLFLTVKAMETRLRRLCWGQRIVAIDEDEVVAEYSALDGAPLDPALLKGDPAKMLAYINLTSGSTGVPKKCMLSHANVVHFVVGAAPAYLRAPETRQLQMYDLQYDGMVDDVFLTHYAGGTICMVPKAHFETRLQDVLRETRATSFTTCPTMGKTLDPAVLPSLKVITLTGEPLTKSLRNRWLAHGKILLNGFGPTETICGFALEVIMHQSAAHDTPVGFAMEKSTRIYILRPNTMQPMPVGCVGEIVVSGPIVGMGYHGDMEKTKEVYVDDPFRKGFRMYRTGDFGRVNHEGRLFFLGRRDMQVGVEGYRVELGQIESVLLQAQSTWLSAVDIVTHKGKTHLAAFLAPRLARINTTSDAQPSSDTTLTPALVAEATAEAKRLKEFATPRLLPMMVPPLWIPLPALPRTATGKLDRKTLRAVFDELEPCLQEGAISSN
ncbi:hypothetical protein BOTBODRAFT_188344 [Botryobasidium botryosum FD-172 SS1]|uniref:AMP-dependent synthetase/ligase domain-containing protein n=1 Tax=Botryobasidium botryosum (strain FD-172 SS1) TaxID=930990 RepID=A0A067MPT5_BOTB1|nr:hypothetical protein BOTBODRAFT_188344 [Botryobasidium botryosum FD-172 SS1]